MFPLFYLAKPTHGGWVTFNAHLCYNLGQRLVYKYSPANKLEDRSRDFGWGIQYQNVPEAVMTMQGKDNLIVTAIEKGHQQMLESFFEKREKPVTLITHDTIELKKGVLDLIKRKKWRVIAIRQKIQEYLLEQHGIESEFVKHPFYMFPVLNGIPEEEKTRTVSISRVDFDKHTEVLLKANKLLPLEKRIAIFGSVNQIYCYHVLDKLLEPLAKPFQKQYAWYHGPIEKRFDWLANNLCRSRFMVDMSAIHLDGGGTQYTFLEAIRCGCPIILNRKWDTGEESLFQEGKNCYMAKDEKELTDIINHYDENDAKRIASNAYTLLEEHSLVNWHSALLGS